MRKVRTVLARSLSSSTSKIFAISSLFLSIEYCLFWSVQFWHTNRKDSLIRIEMLTPAPSGAPLLHNRDTNASSIERPTPPQSRDPRLLNRETHASSIERPTPPQSRDQRLLNRETQ